MSERDVLVVGGGIAGLTLAIALRRSGHRVEVIELQDEWAIAGWGISLTGPTLRALRQLELVGECVEAGYGITEITNCRADGSVVRVLSPPRLGAPGDPAMAGIFRPVFHRILRERAAELGARIGLGLTIERLAQDGTGVAATLSDGSSRRCDLLVGADGLRSRVRELVGIDVAPEYTGQIVWRALVERPEWATSLHTFAGPVHNAGLIPISDRHAYVFLTENGAERERLEDADLAGRMRELLGAFSGPMDAVRESILDPEKVVRRPVEALLVESPWHRGAVLIVGDAAHAPSPQLVSGAALAVEDALVLSDELEAGASAPATLARVGSRRFERCRLVVESSVQIGVWEREGRFDEVHALQDRCFGELAKPI